MFYIHSNHLLPKVDINNFLNNILDIENNGECGKLWIKII
jgi:hypothetical protein